MKLALKPFGTIDPEVLSYLGRELPFFEAVRIADVGDIPERAKERKHGQFRASSFFEACDSEDEDRVLAVTDVDLYEESLSFVFGYAEKPGRIAVISTARLKEDGQERFLERALKEAVHELGHTFGLDHDDGRPECVMHFSHTLEDTDRKSREFCPTCWETVTAHVSPLRT
jgi:archaemetzincin